MEAHDSVGIEQDTGRPYPSADRLLHEIRRPLAAIHAYGELLEDEISGALTVDQRAHVRTILRNARAMDLCFQNLYVLQELDGGKLVMNRQSTNLDEVCRQVVQDYAASFGESGRSLEYTGTARVNAIVDAARLRSVMSRLLDNSLRFTQVDSATRISISEVDDCALIEVNDDGPGLDEGDLVRVFERFERGRREKKRSISGLGIGLAIAKQLVEQMDGTTEAVNSPGGGLCIRMRVPV